jgi:DNA (cytosine-5)-methyltransferase 1
MAVFSTSWDITMSNKRINVLSLFSGCGGLDLGFEGDFSVHAKSVNPTIHSDLTGTPDSRGWIRLPPTGFRTVFANDIFPGARKAWISYFSTRGHSAEEFHLASIVDLVRMHSETDNVFPKVDVVTGGFPCQDFSVSGKRSGFDSHRDHTGEISRASSPTEESRGKLYMWMKQVIEVVRPKVFVAENVKGLVSLSDVKKIIESDFRSIGSGYDVVEARVLKAQRYGIPQSRERVIFLGFDREALTDEARRNLSRSLINPDFDPYPPPTHGAAPDGQACDDTKPLVTVGDYLCDLPEPDQSEDLSQRTYSKAKWYGRHCQGQNEVNLSDIGPTIRAEHHGNIEFRRLATEHGGNYIRELKSGKGERRLTVRECARLQTFPDDYSFVVDRQRGSELRISGSEAYRMIGNAVPPLLGYHLARRLREIWPLFFHS